MTESERLFEAFCVGTGLQVTRILTDGVRRAPDYELVALGGTTVIVEVKQFDPNNEELEAEAALLAGQVRVTGGEPGARLRDAISDANQQIKSLKRVDVPGMLVVYRHPVASRHHTDPYSVLTAVRGLDVVPVIVPSDPKQSPQFLPTRPGSKGRLTEKMNRTISAIGVLRESFIDEKLVLDLFHNPHARVPLSMSAMKLPVVQQFLLKSDKSRWVQA